MRRRPLTEVSGPAAQREVSRWAEGRQAVGEGPGQTGGRRGGGQPISPLSVPFRS
jgi:hypothetical protein